MPRLLRTKRGPGLDITGDKKGGGSNLAFLRELVGIEGWDSEQTKVVAGSDSFRFCITEFNQIEKLQRRS